MVMVVSVEEPGGSLGVRAVIVKPSVAVGVGKYRREGCPTPVYASSKKQIGLAGGEYGTVQERLR